jgi:hypothetical protein
MKNYKVTITETHVYEYEVEGKDVYEAEEKAMELHESDEQKKDPVDIQDAQVSFTHEVVKSEHWCCEKCGALIDGECINEEGRVTHIGDCMEERSKAQAKK